MAKNYFGITDTGKQRANNEDTFIAEKISEQFITACVIDGLGGYAGGEVAAALAKEAIETTLINSPANDVLLLLTQAVIKAHNNIQEKKLDNPDYSQMACVLTIALVDISNNKFYYAHVGDTRLYLLRDKSLIKITKDQSFVGFLEDNGRLTEEEAMQHPKRNEINKALGFDTVIDGYEYIELNDSPFLPGDIILLCSDGLTDMISNAAMSEILNSHLSLKEKAIALVAAANNAGGRDNITVVLVQNDKEQVKEIAVKPVVQKKLNQEDVNSVSVQNITREMPVFTNEKRKSKVIPALSVLLVCALSLAAWLYYQLPNKPVAKAVMPVQLVAKSRNASEQLLSDSINQPLSKEVNLFPEKNQQPIIISDTIFVNKDSLIIHGNGTVISSDSSFNGPAFVLADNCRFIVFDSLVFKNFKTAISVQGNGLYLKKTRFTNCNIPVMQLFTFPDSTKVTGNSLRAIFKIESPYK